MRMHACIHINTHTHTSAHACKHHAHVLPTHACAVVRSAPLSSLRSYQRLLIQLLRPLSHSPKTPSTSSHIPPPPLTLRIAAHSKKKPESPGRKSPGKKGSRSPGRRVSPGRKGSPGRGKGGKKSPSSPGRRKAKSPKSPKSPKFPKRNK